MQSQKIRSVFTRPLSAVAAGVMLLAGCGGGGSSTVVPPVAAKVSAIKYPKVYAAGRIAGFGSIVINGVHYDETKANIVDEDGVSHPSSDLKLGMVAEIQASDLGTVDNSSTGGSTLTAATAQSIVIKSAVQGPVESIDSAAGTVTVLGQLVKVNASTVFDTALVGGLPGIKVGDVVKVYGTALVTGGGYAATRIEPRPGASLYALRGTVTAIDPVAKTVSIGSTTVDVSAISIPDTVKVGSVVRFKLQTTKVNGVWVAAEEKSGADQPQDNDHSELEGTISEYTSAKAFSVDGVPVDASGVTLPAGTVLALGARVSVQGAVVKGVLVATTVKLETEQDVQDEGFDVDGAVTAIDATKSTLVVHDTTVSFDAKVTVTGGALADIKVGSSVEIHGTLATDGTTVNATAIKLRH